MASKFEQWRQSLNNKYGVSEKNQRINNNIEYLRSMKQEINTKITLIHQERQQNLNILKKEIDIKVINYHDELKQMKKEVEDKMKELQENKNKNKNQNPNPNLRKNKRKYSEIE